MLDISDIMNSNLLLMIGENHGLTVRESLCENAIMFMSHGKLAEKGKRKRESSRKYD